MQTTDPNLNPELLQEIEEQADSDSYTDGDMLKYTRRVKMQMVETLTASATLSTDPKDVNALLGVLNSIDKTAQTNMRNKIEEENNSALSQALSIIAAVQTQVGNIDPFLSNNSNTVEPREVVLDAPLVEDLTFVDGELSYEMRDLQYDTFVEGFETPTK